MELPKKAIWGNNSGPKRESIALGKVHPRTGGLVYYFINLIN